MLGELFFGIFYNLSVWYKLTDRTQWGMWFSLLGLGVTLALNIILVPRIGYMGCAIAAFSCYLVMMLASYFVGLKKYPIGYPVGRILSFFAIAGVFLYSRSISTSHGRSARLGQRRHPLRAPCRLCGYIRQDSRYNPCASRRTDCQIHPPPMKVVLINHSDSLGGASVVTYRLLKALRRGRGCLDARGA